MVEHIDLVIPNKNEVEFIKVASKLKYDKLCFLYDSKSFKNAVKGILDLQKTTKIKLNVGLIINKMNNVVNKSNLSVFDASYKSNALIRKVFESRNVDLICNLELNNLKDHTHFVNSGFDQVLCKIAKKRNKIICFDFSQILLVKGKLRSRLLSRIMQNIKICKKYKVGTTIASFAKDPKQMRYYHDLIALLIVLKSDIKSSKKAVKIVCDKIYENEFKKSKSYVTNGVSLN